MTSFLNPELLIERCFQEGINFDDKEIEVSSKLIFHGVVPSNDQLLEAAKLYWDGDSVYDHYDRKLATQYIKHVLLTFFTHETVQGCDGT
jgi:hypothetical protein